jgi:hypothetical protein
MYSNRTEHAGGDLVDVHPSSDFFPAADPEA